MHGNCASGLDGVTVEHLKWGNSVTLRSHLASLYTYMLNLRCVPEVLQTGILVPALKKPQLVPNDRSNYRPITLSSVHSKFIEILLLPKDNVCDAQFGFRKGRSTEFGCIYLHDLISYFHASALRSLYVASMQLNVLILSGTMVCFLSYGHIYHSLTGCIYTLGTAL